MHSASTILVCDHRGAGILEALRPIRGGGARLEFSTSLKESLDRLARTRPALLMVDLLSPGGYHELAAIDRARERPSLVPLLLIRESGEAAAWRRAIRALHAPAWDLVDRDANPEEFRLRIDRLLAETRLHREVRDLRHRASHDDRTDLLRPQAFQARLGEHFSAAQRHGLPMTLAIIDLDDFGSVNKRFDHTVGDEVIAEVGAIVRQTVRAEDVAGRLGGDEFGVLLPYTAPGDAARVVERLRLEIAHLSEAGLGSQGRAVKVSGSLGYAHFDGSNLTTAEELRRRAEQALRQAKVGGGNRAVCFAEGSERADLDPHLATPCPA
jgi:diguanylate cyclase (GGDEF)-like protein